ncbi:MAG: asparagine synthase [Planctomycetes bacterium]|nr:asparagine synthase [Planctomycetota bacterium]
MNDAPNKRPNDQPLARVVNLLDPSQNVIYGMSHEQATEIVATGDPDAVRKIHGHFALVGISGINVRLARTIGKLMRYFIAKRVDGPELIVADRIDAIRDWLIDNGLADQFHPSYTRMVPAHHVVELLLIGCPDPNPTYRRFFAPVREGLPADPQSIGERYMRAVYDEIVRWLQMLPTDAPVGVCFSGGIDSGAVFLLTYHAMLTLGMNPGRLKAFTLSLGDGGADTEQARAFLDAVELGMFLEPIEVSPSDIDLRETIRVVEDYKPLDVQAGAMSLALCRGIRRRYPEWKYLLDGDGGDENLKDYPIEENPELTIRSVLNNRMLYQEGWGVDSIKHSLTYSGGQSRGYARTYGPAVTTGFQTLSPFVALPVIEVAEAIPFIELTGWDHDCLYRLKGDIVSRGVRAITGMEMPVFPKRRFQHGVASDGVFASLFPESPDAYRKIFHALYE